ncbi:hypothetical protein M885DRAFT_623120, partial [Pelagophyceae sp. CCMP2097]
PVIIASGCVSLWCPRCVDRAGAVEVESVYRADAVLHRGAAFGGAAGRRVARCAALPSPRCVGAAAVHRCGGGRGGRRRWARADRRLGSRLRRGRRQDGSAAAAARRGLRVLRRGARGRHGGGAVGQGQVRVCGGRGDGPGLPRYIRRVVRGLRLRAPRPHHRARRRRIRAARGERRRAHRPARRRDVDRRLRGIASDDGASGHRRGRAESLCRRRDRGAPRQAAEGHTARRRPCGHCCKPLRRLPSLHRHGGPPRLREPRLTRRASGAPT